MVNKIRELRSCSIKFKNSFKKLAVTFKIYIDFESVLKEVRGSDRKNNTYILENMKHIFLEVSLTKLHVLMKKLASQLFFTEEKYSQ